jgi:pSer/pThr/pTyr-binding forkhead associated (FHA) protein
LINLPQLLYTTAQIYDKLLIKPVTQNFVFPHLYQLFTIKNCLIIMSEKIYPLLIHEQTNTVISLPKDLPVIHIGKKTRKSKPDIDLSHFPHPEIVSRFHADISIEGDDYYLIDLDSTNGTYVNHHLISSGEKILLKDGDRIFLGKKKLVTFLFLQTPPNSSN